VTRTVGFGFGDNAGTAGAQVVEKQEPQSSPEDCVSGAVQRTVPNAQRASDGRFLPGHRINATHGLESARVPAPYAELERALLERSLADDGGLSEIPARRLSLHEYRSLIHRKVWQVSDALDARGLFDKRGKLRVAWLQRLESLVTQAVRIDSVLGLERRTKDLRTMTAEQYVRHDRQQQENQP